MGRSISSSRNHALLVLAQAFSLVCHFFLNIILARTLGPDAFGRWGVIISALVWFQYSLLWVLPTAMARFIPQQLDQSRDLIRKAFILQFALGIIVMLILGGATFALSQGLREKQLLPYLYIALLDLPASALFLYFQGVLLGFQLFSRRALVMAFYALSKMAFVVTAVLLLQTLDAALLAKVLGTFTTALVAWSLIRGLGNGTGISDLKPVLVFSLPLLFYSLAHHLVMKLDLFMVKALIEQGADAGYYNSALVLAQAPYFVLSALFAAVVPTLSAASAQNDMKAASYYISLLVRVLLLLLWPGYVLIAASAPGIIQLVFSAEYLAAGPALSILCLAFFGYAMFFLIMTSLTGLGKPGLATLLTTGLLLVDFSLQAVFIPRFGINGAALASLSATVLVLCAASAVLARVVKLKPNLIFALTCIAGGILIGRGLYWFDLSGLVLIPAMGAAAIVYYLMLILTKQLSRKDLDLLLDIFGSNK